VAQQTTIPPSIFQFSFSNFRCALFLICSFSLSRLVLSLCMAVQLRRIEVDWPQISRGVPLRLVIKVFRRRVTALAAGSHCDRANSRAEFDYCDKAIAARAINLLRSFV
jgi:hypothetical protein